MVNRCVVFGCNNEPKPDVALHEFPSSKTDRERWRRFVCRTRRDWNGPTKISVICSKHFLDSEFDNLGQYKLGMAKRLRLKKGATPSIYPEGTCHSQAKGGRGHAPPEMTTAMRKREAFQVGLSLNE